MHFGRVVTAFWLRIAAQTAVVITTLTAPPTSAAFIILWVELQRTAQTRTEVFDMNVKVATRLAKYCALWNALSDWEYKQFMLTCQICLLSISKFSHF